MYKEKYGYKYDLIDDGHAVHIIDATGVNIFLLLGKDRGLLIDTGRVVGELKKLCNEFVSEYYVVNSHGHYDHVAADDQFERIYISYIDIPLLKDSLKSDVIPFETCDLCDGQVFDLGDRKVTAVHLPGHTAGSFGFLDKERRIIYSGDSLMRNVSIQHNGNTGVLGYRETLVKLLKEYYDKFDYSIPGHGHRAFGFRPLEKEYITKMIECIDSIDINKSYVISQNERGDVYRFVADGRKYEDYDSVSIEFNKVD